MTFYLEGEFGGDRRRSGERTAARGGAARTARDGWRSEAAPLAAPRRSGRAGKQVVQPPLQSAVERVKGERIALHAGQRHAVPPVGVLGYDRDGRTHHAPAHHAVARAPRTDWAAARAGSDVNAVTLALPRARRARLARHAQLLALVDDPVDEILGLRVDPVEAKALHVQRRERQRDRGGVGLIDQAEAGLAGAVRLLDKIVVTHVYRKGPPQVAGRRDGGERHGVLEAVGRVAELDGLVRDEAGELVGVVPQPRRKQHELLLVEDGLQRQAVPERLVVVPAVVDKPHPARPLLFQRLAHAADRRHVGLLALREARVLPDRLRHRVPAHLLPRLRDVDDRRALSQVVGDHHRVSARVQHGHHLVDDGALHAGQSLKRREVRQHPVRLAAQPLRAPRK
mmetsp:Transcript_36749/g.63140  ORF Transcript_36749/g.63140 Transcript_36749/m.63140 type:complete len:397 (+) Transcript_36749:130-1320(+)